MKMLIDTWKDSFQLSVSFNQVGIISFNLELPIII